MSENVDKKNNLLKIIIWVLLFVILGFFSYSFFIKGENPIDTIVDSLVNVSWDKELNYSFKFDWKVEWFDKEWELLWNLEMSLWESQIYSSKDAFNQMIRVNDLVAKEMNENWEWDEKFRLSFDFISNKFKNYFTLKSSQKQEILWELKNSDIGLFEKIADILSEVENDDYVMIDNEKTTLKVLGDLSKNEIIKNLFLSLWVSNTDWFLKETKTLEKLKEELKNDKIINYIFVKSWEATKEDWKTKEKFILADNICSDYLPLFNNVMEQIYKMSGSYAKANFPNLEECQKWIQEINPKLKMFTQIYKIWDIEKGNYDFVISMWDSYNWKITYKSHKLKSWEIKWETPNKKDFVLNISGDENWIKNSLVQVDLSDDFSGMSIKWEIKDGNWELVLDSKNKENWLFANVKLDKYYLENIDLKGLNNSKEIFSLKWKITKEEINIKWLVKDFEKVVFELVSKDDYFKFNLVTQVGKINLVYDDWKIDGSINSPMLKVGLKWKYKNKKDFNFKLINENNSYVDLKSKWWVIDILAKINSGFESIDLKWKYKDLNDFSFKLTDENNPEKNYMVSEAKKEWKLVKYMFKTVSDSVLNFAFDWTLSKWEKDGFKKYNLVWEYTSWDWIIKFDYNFYLKEGGAKYEIPKQFKEVEVDFMQMPIFPAINPGVIKQQIKNATNSYYILAGWTIWALWATTAFITLQDYPKEARNSKRMADVSNLATKINMVLAMNPEKFDDIVINYSEKNITKGKYNMKVKIWNINFDVIWESKDSFKAPFENEEYKMLSISWTDNDWNKIKCFELGAIEEGSNYNVFTKGNCWAYINNINELFSDDKSIFWLK